MAGFEYDLARTPIYAYLGDMVQRDGFLQRPPIKYHSIGPDVRANSRAGAVGSFDDVSGHHESVGVPHFADTFLTGTGGRTGFEFTGASGSGVATARDDWMSPYSKHYGIAIDDGALDKVFDLTMVNTQPNNPLHVVLRRGYTAFTASDTQENVYCYLELNHGLVPNKGQYRLEFVTGSPICLQYKNTTYDQTWVSVASSSKHPNFDAAIKRDREIQIRIIPDDYHGSMTVVVDGHRLYHAAPKPKDAPWLQPFGQIPAQLCLRLYGKNGTCHFEVHQVRHKPVKITSQRYPLKDIVPTSDVKVTVNKLSQDDGGKVTNLAVSQNGDKNLQFSATVDKPDNGDGNGSNEPTRVSDITVTVPSQWSGGTGNYSPGRLPVIQYTETNIWDDVSRIGHTYGEVVVQNYDRAFTYMHGAFAFNLIGTNGRTSAPRVYGIAGEGKPGISLEAYGPYNIARMSFTDNLKKLEDPLGQEYIADGESIYTAVRFLLECGGIHPKYLGYVQPAQDPPYPDGFSQPIIPKGSGMNPKFRFGPEDRIIDCIRELATKVGMIVEGFNPPWTALSIPMYLWADPFGNIRFEPWVPDGPVKSYSTDARDEGQILGIRVDRDVDNLRTEITVQGQHSLDHSFMQLQVPLLQNLPFTGRRRIAIERSDRFVSEAAMFTAARNLARQSSLGSEIVTIQAMYDPQIYARDTIWIHDRAILGKRDLYVIQQIHSVVGMADPYQKSPMMTAQSTLVCRHISADIPF